MYTEAVRRKGWWSSVHPEGEGRGQIGQVKTMFCKLFVQREAGQKLLGRMPSGDVCLLSVRLWNKEKLVQMSWEFWEHKKRFSMRNRRGNWLTQYSRHHVHAGQAVRNPDRNTQEVTGDRGKDHEVCRWLALPDGPFSIMSGSALLCPVSCLSWTLQCETQDLLCLRLRVSNRSLNWLRKTLKSD